MLPSEVLSALNARQSETPGQYDQEAWRAFDAAPQKMRQRATWRASVVSIAAPLIAEGANWAEVSAAVQAQFGDKAPSESSIRNWCAACDGVAPVNRGPALLDNFAGGGRRAEMSPEAWHWCTSFLRHCHEKFPLKEAHFQTKRMAEFKGWTWPSYQVMRRRLQEIEEFEWLFIRGGRRGTKHLHKAIQRDKTSLLPLDIGTLDGRCFDTHVEMPDGRVVRLWMIALCDVASRKIVGYRVAESETAEETVRLALRSAKEHGPFEDVWADNGSAFISQLVSGGAKHRFVGAPARGEDELPGAFAMLGTRIHFNIPASPRGKQIERSFRDFAEWLDKSFGPAYGGNRPGAVDKSKVVPVSLDVFLCRIADSVRQYNRRTDHRIKGLPRNTSFNSLFDAGLVEKAKRDNGLRKVSPDQIRKAGLHRKEATVLADGTIRAWGRQYGFVQGDCPLLPFIGEKVWIQGDSDDLDEPIMVYTTGGRTLISAEVPAMPSFDYSDPAGAAESARRAAALNARRREVDEKYNWLPWSELERDLVALALADEAIPETVAQPTIAKLTVQPMSGRRPADEAPDEDGPSAADMERYRARAARAATDRLAARDW